MATNNVKYTIFECATQVDAPKDHGFIGQQ
jgi:hypothetical protein